MQHKSITAVLAVVSVLFVGNLTMFAQASQNPAAVPGTGAPSNNK